MTVKQVFTDYIQQLQGIYSSDEARIMAEWVLESIAGIAPARLKAQSEEVLPETVRDILAQKLTELLTHRPIQYVLGEAWFYRMRWLVNEQVLIPRPETEELVEKVVEELRMTNNRMTNDKASAIGFRPSILDIGTGSGCIAVTLKKLLPAATVTAIDVSEGALAVAKANAETHEAVVNFLQVDFLQQDNWSLLGQYDVIVSNPPYIPLNEKEKMDVNVTAYEPGLALFVSNENALLFYEAIAAFGLQHLTPGGFIAVEVHESYAQQTAASFSTRYTAVTVVRDISGKERMVMARNS